MRIGKSRGIEIEKFENLPEKEETPKRNLSEIKTAWIDRIKSFYSKYNCKLVLGVKRQPEIQCDDNKKKTLK